MNISGIYVPYLSNIRSYRTKIISNFKLFFLNWQIFWLILDYLALLFYKHLFHIVIRRFIYGVPFSEWCLPCTVIMERLKRAAKPAKERKLRKN